MKSRILSWPLALLLLMASFASCEDKTDPPAKPESLQVTPLSIEFKDNTSEQVTVTCSGKWNASFSDGSWCAADKESGNGDDVITVSLKKRTVPGPLSSVLTIVAEGSSELTEKVALSAPAVGFTVDPSSVVFSKNSTGQDITITYSGNWTADLSDSSWCSIDTQSGYGNGTVRITMTSTEGFGSKTSVLTIASTDFPSLSATIPISQSGDLQHGDLTMLNKATIGKGIDIVILGDGFTADDLKEGGKWASTMTKCQTAVFKKEPFKSFKAYFNLYAVAAESATDVIGTSAGNTFFKSYFANERQFFVSSANREKAYSFAYDNSPVKEDKGTMKDMLVIMLVNDTRYGGGGYMDDSGSKMGTGMGTSSMNSQYFEYLIIHESLGHSFGKLADEYESYSGSINNATGTYSVKQSKADKASYGHWRNIEFTSDPEQFDNVYWREFYGSDYPGVKIIEGGHYYPKDVWRSSDDSLMRSTGGEFNTVCREILVRRIYQLAGKSAEYSMEVFKEYDKTNTAKSQAEAWGAINLPPTEYLAPPIVGD